MKNEELKKIIGKAIEACTSHHTQGVKKHLIGAMREASVAEEKMNKTSRGDINKNWMLDLASGSIKNMSKTEVGRALVNIEKMIADEENKNKSKPNEDIFID
jgi:hypothetical protein